VWPLPFRPTQLEAVANYDGASTKRDLLEARKEHEELLALFPLDGIVPEATPPLTS